jgi:translocation and assembly module TamB
VRWKKLLVGVLVVVGLLVPAALVGLRTAPAREEIRRQVAVLLGQETGLRVEIGDVDLRYLPPEVTVRRVRIDHPTEGLLARAERLEITPRVWAMASGRLEVDEVVVDAAVLRLVVKDGKLANGPQLAKRVAEDSTDEPPFQGLTLSDTTVIVETDVGLSGHVRGVDLDVSAEDGGVLEGRLRAVGGLVRHDGLDEPIGALEVRAALTRDAVIVRRIDLKVGDVRLRASEGTLARTSPLDADIGVQVQGPATVAARLGVTDPVLQGSVSVTARLGVHGDAWSASGTARLVRPQIDEFVVGDSAELPFRVDPSGVTIERGVVHAAHGQARIPTAHIAFDESVTLDADVTFHDLRLAEVLENLTLPNSHCEILVVGGGGRFHGTLSPFRIDSVGDALVDGRDVRVTLEGWHDEARTNVLLVPAAQLRTRLRFDASGVRFRQSRLDFGRSTMGLEAHLRLAGDFEVHGRSDRIDYDDVNPLTGFDIGGKGTLHFDITGAYEDPLITGHTQIAAFRFHTFVFGDVDTDLSYRNLVIRSTNGRGTRGRTRFTVPAGELDFGAQVFTAKATVLSDRMVLSEFYEIWHVDTDPDFTEIQGEGHGTALIRYAANVLDVDYDATLADMTVYGERFAEGALRGHWKWVDRNAGWRGGDVDFDELTLRKGGGTVSVDGHTRRGGVLDLFVVADRIALADVDQLPPEARGLGAVFGVHFPLRGTLENLDVRAGRLGLSEVRLGGLRLGTSDVSFDVRGPLVTLQGDLLGGQVGLAVHARRTPGIPFAGRIELRDFALGWLLARLGVPAAAGASGVATGVVQIDRGLLSRPDDAEGRLTLSVLRLGVGDYTLANTAPVRLSFGGGGVSVDTASFAGRSTRLDLAGTLHDTGALALRMHGEVYLDFLSGLYPELEEVHGTVSIDGNLGGTRRRPLFLGSATLAGGSVKLQDVDERLDNVSGTVQFSQSRLLVQDFQGRLGNGRVTMDGSVRLAGADLAGYTLGIGLRDVGVRLDDEGTSTVLDGALQLRWARGERLPTLEGDLDVVRLRYEREILLADFRQLDRRARRVEVEEYDPARDHVALAVRLHGSDNLVVANNLLDAEFRIDETSGPLQLVGTDQRLGLVGELALTRGTLRFRNNNFDIARGAITFDDRTKIDPRFDVSAETEVRDWRVRLQALGSADEFRVFTTSEPELPEEDVLLLLALGVTRDELSDQDTNSGQIGGQAAIEALAAVTGVDREVRRVVPIDDIRIGSTYSTQTNRSEPTLSIGKRVGRNVRVTATTGLGEARDVSASVEWRLNRNLSVEGGYDNNDQQSTLGNVGVDLRFRLEFE